MKTTETPKYQNYHIPGVLHISPKDAFESIANGEAILLDVREANEYQYEIVDLPEITFLPLTEFMGSFSTLPKDQKMIVVCASGIRSVQVVGFLKQHGFDNAINLDGGNYAMKSENIPYRNQ